MIKNLNLFFTKNASYPLKKTTEENDNNEDGTKETAAKSSSLESILKREDSENVQYKNITEALLLSTKNNLGKTIPDNRNNLLNWDNISELGELVPFTNNFLGICTANSDTYKALEPYREQLLSYIKNRLDLVGNSYNDEQINKILNMAISDVLDGRLCIQGSTISDIIDKILDTIDRTIACDTTDKKTTLACKMANIIKLSENDTEQANMNPYLQNTADYYLTNNEQMIKKVLNSISKGYSYELNSKEELISYINAYADYLVSIFSKDFPSIGDTIKNIKEDFIKNITPNNNGIFILNQSLATKFMELCQKAVGFEI